MAWFPWFGGTLYFLRGHGIAGFDTGHGGHGSCCWLFDCWIPGSSEHLSIQPLGSPFTKLGWVGLFLMENMVDWSQTRLIFRRFLRMNIGRAQKWLMPGTTATGVTVHVTTVVSWPGNGRNASPCVVFCTQVRYRNKQRQNQQNYTKLQPNLSKRNMKE